MEYLQYILLTIMPAESCPLNNDVSKNKVIKMHESMEPNLAKFIEKIVGCFSIRASVVDKKKSHDITYRNMFK